MDDDRLELTPQYKSVRTAKATKNAKEVYKPQFKPDQPKDCPRCHGTGKNGEDSVFGYPGYTCYYCGGTGAWPYMRNVEPSVPAEVSLCSVCQAMTHTIGGNCGKCGCLKPNVLADEVQVELDVFALDGLVNIVIAFAHGKATAAEISAKKTSVQALIARSNQQAVVEALEEALEGLRMAGKHSKWDTIDEAIARAKAEGTNHE